MINLEWVKDYIDIGDISPEELAERVTKTGINIEKIISNHINNLVIGEVISCKDHPNSDHLRVCEVNTGSKCIQVVCGASNVKEGIRVIVALPNSVLPVGPIEETCLRGVKSEGMICALCELGFEENSEVNRAKGIMVLPADAPLGADPLQYLGLDDVVYELDVHKHRNNDCYYHIGFAYIVGAVLNRRVKLPYVKFDVCKDSVNDFISLRVDTSKCPYYLGRMVRDVKVGPTPEFIKRRLNSVGIRSINNVVDISNYVMLEFGQPLHFFDSDSLGSNVLVRDARDGEEIITLDGQKRVLNSDDIVITDGNKPVCIAGVMGGDNTAVTENTKSLFIESAIFDAVSIRNTASKLNLKSEASIRYGKGLNYEYTDMAMDRACELLEMYAGATVLSGTASFDNIVKTPRVVSFRAEEINGLLGTTISDSDIELELNKLGFDFLKRDGVYIVTIPNRRLDIEENINDIAEEIGRLYGYHNLKGTLPRVETKRGRYLGDVWYSKVIGQRMRSLGFNEVRTYTLVSRAMAELFNYEGADFIALPNPMSSDKEIIRTSILASLLNVYEYNMKRRVSDIFIYEIGKTYDRNFDEDLKLAMLMRGNFTSNSVSGVSVKGDFYLLKGMVENVLNYMGMRGRYDFDICEDAKGMHPYVTAKILLDGKVIGVLGRVHPAIVKDDVFVCELSVKALMGKVDRICYVSPSKYPSICKDLAFIVDKGVSTRDVEGVIWGVNDSLLADIRLFDVYVGDNIPSDKKSLAYSLVFQSRERTLTEEEVMGIMERIVVALQREIGAELRK